MIYGNTFLLTLYFTLDTPTQIPQAIHTEASRLVCLNTSTFFVCFWFVWCQSLVCFGWWQKRSS